MKHVKELLDKISSYNIFNNLLPGILYVVLLNEFFNINLIQEQFFIGIFLYYFIGLFISRIGSLIVEPLLIKMKILRFSEYSEYILACERDSKLERLSESNNMYRTLISLALAILLSRLYLFISVKFELSKSIEFYLLSFLILVTFIFAYIKQTNYITSRIQNHQNKHV